MFPFSANIQLSDGNSVGYQEVLKHICPLLTANRLERTKAVVAHRDFGVSVVLENIYDRGNSSAVFRSAEAFGFARIEVIENGEKFKEAKRTTAGADKWLEVRRWKSTKECVSKLKSEGKKIYATHLDATAVSLESVDLNGPCAIVLGNEHAGCSPEILEAADARVILPMFGFVQSFNISVAGALALQTIHRIRRERGSFQLSEQEREILTAVYALRTLDSADSILKEVLKKNEEKVYR